MANTNIKITLSSTERSRRFRAKLQDKSEEAQKLREKDRLRKQEERSRIKSKQEQEVCRVKKREEMRRYRAKKKGNEDDTAITSLDSKKVTGGRKAMKKLKGRTATRVSRERQKELESAKKKKKQMAVLRTQQWRLRVKLFNMDNDVSSTEGFSSYWSERRMINKVRDILPQTPSKKAKIIEKLQDSPNTSKILQHKGVIINPEARRTHQVEKAVAISVRKHLEESKPKGGCSLPQLRAYKHIKGIIQCAPLSTSGRAKACIRSYFNICAGIRCRKPQSSEWWQLNERKKRKDRLNEEVKQSVREFLLSPDISREVPMKAEALKVKDESGHLTLVAKHTMSMTMEEAFRGYKEVFPNNKIGLSSFKKLKPSNVRKLSETNRRTCLCSTCCNLALKVEAIKKFVQAKRNENPINAAVMTDLMNVTKTSLADSVLCPYAARPQNDCLYRTCEVCENKNADVLAPAANFRKEVIPWYHWEYINIMKDDKPKKIMSCIEKVTDLEAFDICLKSDLQVYPAHIFRANWQHKEMGSCIKTLQPNQVVLLMDYSENYRCVFKDEVQSGYFDQRQVSIHPMMSYYLEDGNLVKHAIIGISPETKHDAHLTRAFEDKALCLLQEQPSLQQLQLVIEWTDGCSAQYKCKTSTADISLRAQGDFYLHRNFFETSHGKSPCDGLGSVVKNTCLKAVKTGKAVLGDARALMDFCKVKLGHGAQKKEKAGKVEISKWDFVYIEQVLHDRPETQILPLKGIRKLHSVQSTNDCYEIGTRPLSCYCLPCRTQGMCLNTPWVEPWKKCHLVHVNTKISNVTTDSTKKEPEHSTDSEESMVEPGDFVAVKLSMMTKRSNPPLHVYFAEVLDEDEDGIVVKYMDRTQGNLYRWPDEPDVSRQPITDIICKLNPPILQNGRAMFKFSQQDFESVMVKFDKKQKSAVYFK